MELDVKLNRNEMSMIRLVCGFTWKEMKKNAELRETFRLETVSLVIKKVDWDGLDTWNIKIILTGLNIVHRRQWKELKQGDIQWRHGGIVSRRIWKYLVCQGGCTVSEKMERKGNGSLGRCPLNWCICLCYSIVYHYNGAQRYEQFLQGGRLDQTLSLHE